MNIIVVTDTDFRKQLRFMAVSERFYSSFTTFGINKKKFTDYTSGDRGNINFLKLSRDLMLAAWSKCHVNLMVVASH